MDLLTLEAMLRISEFLDLSHVVARERLKT